MSEAVKFTKEEIEEVKSIQRSYIDVQNQFGQIALSRIRLENQLNALDDTEGNLEGNLQELQDKEQAFLDKITEKYGRGTLNPETGEFTPNPS